MGSLSQYSSGAYCHIESISISLLVFAALALYIFATKFNDQASLKCFMLGGFVIRVIIAAADQAFNLLPYGWDDFFSVAMIIKQNIRHGYPLFENITESMHIVSYALFSSFFYIILGDHQIIMRIINAFLSVLAAERLYQLSMQLQKNSKAAGIAMMIMLFFPSFILFGSLDMRDALFLYLSMDTLLRFARLIDGDKSHWIVLLIELPFLFVLRTQNIILFIGILFFYLSFKVLMHSSRKMKSAFLLLIGIGLVLFLISAAKVPFFNSLLEYINHEMRWRATTGGSSYLADTEYHTWLDVLVSLPLRFVYFLFGPFPWMINNMFMIDAFLENLFFIVLFILSLSDASRSVAAQRPHIYLLLLCYAFIGIAGNAIIDSNFGTAIRHKLNYIGIFFILAAFPLQHYRIKAASK